MFNRLNLTVCLVLTSVALTGCGNKGELFLSTTPQLPEQLDAARDVIDETSKTPPEDAATTKKKTQPAEP